MLAEFKEYFAHLRGMHSVARLKLLGFAGLRSVLDAGCGDGEWLEPLAQLNESVCGIDTSIAACERAQERVGSVHANVSIQAASILNIPFPDSSFDAIFCFDTLMYVNPMRAFAEFGRALKPNGFVYCAMNGPGAIPFYIFAMGLKGGDVHKINMGIRSAADTLLRHTIAPGRDVVNTFYTKNDIIKLASATGLAVEYFGAEGTYKNEGFREYPPSFRQMYMGLPLSYEALLRKI